MSLVYKSVYAKWRKLLLPASQQNKVKGCYPEYKNVII